MSFLKKFGQALVNATAIITGFGPIIGAAIPGDKDDRIITGVQDRLDSLLGAVLGAEVFGAALKLPGADKAKAAAPAMFQILMSAKLIAGKKLKDPAKAKAAAEAMGGNLADFLNAFED